VLSAMLLWSPTFSGQICGAGAAAPVGLSTFSFASLPLVPTILFEFSALGQVMPFSALLIAALSMARHGNIRTEVHLPRLISSAMGVSPTLPSLGNATTIGI